MGKRFKACQKLLTEARDESARYRQAWSDSRSNEAVLNVHLSKAREDVERLEGELAPLQDRVTTLEAANAECEVVKKRLRGWVADADDALDAASSRLVEAQRVNATLTKRLKARAFLGALGTAPVGLQRLARRAEAALIEVARAKERGCAVCGERDGVEEAFTLGRSVWLCREHHPRSDEQVDCPSLWPRRGAPGYNTQLQGALIRAAHKLRGVMGPVGHGERVRLVDAVNDFLAVDLKRGGDG